MNDALNNLTDDELAMLEAAGELPEQLRPLLRERLAADPSLQARIDRLIETDRAVEQSLLRFPPDIETRRTLDIARSALRQGIVSHARITPKQAPRASTLHRWAIGAFGAVAALVVFALWIANTDPQTFFDNKTIAEIKSDQETPEVAQAQIEHDASLLLASFGGFVSESQVVTEELAALELIDSDFALFTQPQ